MVCRSPFGKPVVQLWPSDSSAQIAVMTMNKSHEMDDAEAAALVDRLLRSGIPLTLIADLISPFGPESQRILAEEQAEDDDPEGDDFSQSGER